MSAYYVVGSDIELKNINRLNVGFEEISARDLKNYIKDLDLCKKHYYVSNIIMSLMIYQKDNKNLNYNYDNQETDLLNFVKYLKSENIEFDNIEFFKFLSIFDNNDKNKTFNEIFLEKSINIYDFNETEDFEYNTKYIFSKKKENNLEL